MLETGRLVLPTDADIGSFLLTDGNITKAEPTVNKRKLRRLGQLSEAFLAAIPKGALEVSTIKGMKAHLRHLKRVMGASFDLPTLQLEDLQAYVEKRGREPGQRGRQLSVATIKKELTLRTLWNWAGDAGHLSGPFSLKGVRFPKGADRPPFQTLQEIERRIARGGLSALEQDELWSALFLTTSELSELLDHVRKTSSMSSCIRCSFFAAHTGARRSEILRGRHPRSEVFLHISCLWCRHTA